MAEYKTHQKNNFKYISKLRENPTESEQNVKRLLDQIGEPYIFQKGFLKPFHRIADFYLPRIKTIVEVDGGYHKHTKSRDRLKDELWCSTRGMKTVRIDEKSIFLT